MQIWPAIDLRGGKCVRLKQGDYAQETVYGEDPAAGTSILVANLPNLSTSGVPGRGMWDGSIVQSRRFVDTDTYAYHIEVRFEVSLHGTDPYFGGCHVLFQHSTLGY